MRTEGRRSRGAALISLGKHIFVANSAIARFATLIETNLWKIELNGPSSALLRGFLCLATK